MALKTKFFVFLSGVRWGCNKRIRGDFQTGVFLRHCRGSESWTRKTKRY